jgi:hypothetical protein
MSLITDALKQAASLEKTISRQDVEIANLKAKVEFLTIAKAGADENARVATATLKQERKDAKSELASIQKSHKTALAEVQKELKEVRAELKKAAKAPKAVKSVTPTNDALGQVKRKPGRPKKAAADVPETPAVDPRQINIPDLGEPAPGKTYVGGADAPVPMYQAENTSAKGNTYEFV